MRRDGESSFRPIPVPPFPTSPRFTQTSPRRAAARARSRPNWGCAGAPAPRLSGRLIAGFERPGVDAARGGRAVRSRRVHPCHARGAGHAPAAARRTRRARRSAEEILGALTGVTLAPADLQAILTGCVVPAPKPVGGRLHQNGWASIDLAGGATMYLRRKGAWQMRAGRRNGWEVEYPSWQGTFPQVVRLRSASEPRTWT